MRGGAGATAREGWSPQRKAVQDGRGPWVSSRGGGVEVLCQPRGGALVGWAWFRLRQETGRDLFTWCQGRGPVCARRLWACARRSQGSWRRALWRETLFEAGKGEERRGGLRRAGGGERGWRETVVRDARVVAAGATALAGASGTRGPRVCAGQRAEWRACERAGTCTRRPCMECTARSSEQGPLHEQVRDPCPGEDGR